MYVSSKILLRISLERHYDGVYDRKKYQWYVNKNKIKSKTKKLTSIDISRRRSPIRIRLFRILFDIFDIFNPFFLGSCQIYLILYKVKLLFLEFFLMNLLFGMILIYHLFLDFCITCCFAYK